MYLEDDNLLGDRLHTVQKNTEILLVALKEITSEENNEKTTYTFMYREKGRNIS